MYDDYWYEVEQKKNRKSEEILAGTFVTVLGFIMEILLSFIFGLIRRFDILSSCLASVVVYMITYNPERNRTVQIIGVFMIFIISMILQYAFGIARIIYTLFVCVVFALIGGCWKTYDTEIQRNMVMLVCFVVAAFFGIASWHWIAKE